MGRILNKYVPTILCFLLDMFSSLCQANILTETLMFSLVTCSNNAGRMIRTAPSRFANYIQDNWTKPNEKGIDPRRLYITSGLRKTTYSKVHSYLGP